MNTEIEAGVANLKTCCEAIRECMLEGDEFIEEPARKTGASLTVRYYCDNLSEDRRKYSEVNALKRTDLIQSFFVREIEIIVINIHSDKPLILIHVVI